MKTLFKLLTVLGLLYNCNLNGQDWIWKNPIPTGNKLNSIEFADSITAYAIGNSGTILKTTDGGYKWNMQLSNTDLNLYSISIIDKDTLYVCGENLNVFKTKDGGNTWTCVFDQGGSNNTNFIFFVNPAIGYIAGDGTTLYKTTDYGITWVNLNVGIEFQQVTSIFFTSNDTGYASVGNGMAGIVLKTTNGGHSWSTISLPVNEQFNKITFVNDSTGFLIGFFGAILQTNDFGSNWTIQNDYSSGITFSNLLSIDFVDDKIGFIVGGKDILKTIDGGVNWEQVEKSDFDLFSISFVDSLHGITVGGDWLYEVSGILISENGGLLWNEISSAIINDYIDEIKFINFDTGYAVGGNVSATYSGYIIKTVDAGETWSQLNTGMNTYWLTDIDILLNGTIYVIAEYGQILKSIDEGLTWTQQNSNTTKSLYSLNFLNNDTGYIVGENGTILRTNNGGTTWIKKESPTDKNLNTLYFKDANTGFIPFYDWNIDSTVLLSTKDGGSNWNQKSIGLLRYPRKIYFINNDTGFIVGDFGGILRTFDGGNSWESSYHHGNDYFDIYFTNNNTGYVVGDDGEISMTENCGNDWTVVNSGTDKQLRSVFFTDVNTGYAVGSNGIILKTTNSGSSLKKIYQSYYNICLGDAISITPNTIGGTKPLTYHWENGETSPSLDEIPQASTTYQVTVIDNELYSIVIDMFVYVTNIDTPKISYRNDTLFSDIIYGNQWYRNDTIIPYVFDNWLIPNLTGSYYSIICWQPCFSEKSNIIQVNTLNTRSSIKVNKCESYISPSEKYTWNASGTYMDTIPNITGYDSIITIHLTIDQVDISVHTFNSVLTANNKNASYRWLNCNDNYSVIVGAIDYTFMPAESGNYAVEISEGNCIDTSDCYEIIKVGIIQNNLNTSLIFFPNPTHGDITIKFDNIQESIDLILKDIYGRIISKNHYQFSNLIKYKISNPKGLYLIELITEDGNSTFFKVINN